MNRGEIWTVSGGAEYTGKPRPAAIIQDDSFDATTSITLCLCTSDPTEAPLFRILVEPNTRNGLHERCSIMVDKITTVSKARLGERIGRLDDEDLVRLNQAILVFLGMAGAPRSNG